MFPHPGRSLAHLMKTLEERVASLEQELASLKSQPWLSPRLKKDPLSTFGSARDDPGFDEATRLGEEYRRSQTYEKEIEARGGVGY